MRITCRPQVAPPRANIHRAGTPELRSQHVVKPREHERDRAVFDDVVGGAVALFDVLFDAASQLVASL